MEFNNIESDNLVWYGISDGKPDIIKGEKNISLWNDRYDYLDSFWDTTTFLQRIITRALSVFSQPKSENKVLVDKITLNIKSDYIEHQEIYAFENGPITITHHGSYFIHIHSEVLDNNYPVGQVIYYALKILSDHCVFKGSIDYKIQALDTNIDNLKLLLQEYFSISGYEAAFDFDETISTLFDEYQWYPYKTTLYSHDYKKGNNEHKSLISIYDRAKKAGYDTTYTRLEFRNEREYMTPQYKSKFITNWDFLYSDSKRIIVEDIPALKKRVKVVMGKHDENSFDKLITYIKNRNEYKILYEIIKDSNN